MLNLSIVAFFIVVGLGLQRYNLLFNIQIFLQFFFIFFCDGLRCRFADYERFRCRFAVYETTRQQDYKWLPHYCQLLAIGRLPHDSLSRRSFRASVLPAADLLVVLLSGRSPSVAKSATCQYPVCHHTSIPFKYSPCRRYRKHYIFRISISEPRYTTFLDITFFHIQLIIY